VVDGDLEVDDREGEDPRDRERRTGPRQRLRVERGVEGAASIHPQIVPRADDTRRRR